MKSYGRKPTTASGKRMSLSHLKLQNKIDKIKMQDHKREMMKGIDVEYHKAHMKGHMEDLKQRQKYMKKAMKMKVKKAK